jgi:hypothetical protein
MLLLLLLLTFISVTKFGYYNGRNTLHSYSCSTRVEEVVWNSDTKTRLSRRFLDVKKYV